MYYYYRGSATEEAGLTWDIAQLNEGDILSYRRKELKLKQQEVADLAGVQLRQYQRFESGAANIMSSSGKVLLAVCKALKLDPYIFDTNGNEPPETKHIILPPLAKQGLTYAIPAMAYYTLISAIPRGMVCSDDDLMACLRAAYGERLELERDINSAELYMNDSFPFWRVVSAEGYLVNHFFCSKEKQLQCLKSEGVEVAQIGEQERFRVVDYIFRKYNTAKFKLTILKTDQQIVEQYMKISRTYNP